MMQFHPAMEAALRQLDFIRQHFDMTGEQAAASIHVQINDEVECDIRKRSHGYFIGRQSHHSALTFMGIHFYTIHDLPEPGWRVIAPSR